MSSKQLLLVLPGLAFVIVGIACSSNSVTPVKTTAAVRPTELEPKDPPAGMAKATFASGCFWCSEAVFQQVKGVRSVVSGYSGGSVQKPSYDEVSTGATGHAEAVQVTYDPAVVKYQDLLEIFWKTHDPTTPDRQGYDLGPQYRSVVFYHDDEQKQLAEHFKNKLNKSGIFDKAIVTQIVPFTEFYRAEAYHQNYYAENPQQRYCQLVIGPKLQKLNELFHDKLK